MKSSLVYTTLAVFALGVTLSASARDVVLPAGTLLQCTLDEPNFSSATAAIGDPVLCHLHGVTEFGQQAFPRGSYLVGHLEAGKDPGHFVGKGYIKLQFDRIGLPSGDLPVEAKVIATRGYRVDREGDIRGSGHAKRDVAEWLLPPLWPEKVLMLPARGPRPALKGESVLTLRLMDDVQLPQVAEKRTPPDPAWYHFGPPKNESFREIPVRNSEPQLATSDAQLSSSEVPQLSLANLVTRNAATPATPSPIRADALERILSEAAPGVPVFLLKSGAVLSVASYCYEDGRLTYNLASGGSGVVSTNDIDWSTTTSLNNQRGVRVTLHRGHPEPGSLGM